MSNVISDRFWGVVVHENRVKFGDPVPKKFHPKPSEASFSALFRTYVRSDVISIDVPTGGKVPVKFGDS